MKKKHIARIGGAALTLGFSPAASIFGKTALSTDSLETKILYGTFSLVATIGALDGIYDLVRGTHHYVGIWLYKNITRDQNKKKEAQLYLEKTLARREYESLN